MRGRRSSISRQHCVEPSEDSIATLCIVEGDDQILTTKELHSTHGMLNLVPEILSSTPYGATCTVAKRPAAVRRRRMPENRACMTVLRPASSAVD